jgi:hypothetical protein
LRFPWPGSVLAAAGTTSEQQPSQPGLFIFS